jgi:maleate isomerase
MIETLERDLGKPVISSNQAMMWHALRSAGIREAVPGFGKLFSID